MIEDGAYVNNIHVLSFYHKSEPGKSRKYYYRCECPLCGNVFIGREDSIKSGHTKSCGCWHKKVLKKKKRLHGMSGTRFYRAWQNMKARCDKANTPYAKNYSLRGITYDSRWNDFESFKEDMYCSYSEHYAQYGDDTSLDKIDVNGNYCKDNCRWVTHKVNDNNKTTSHMLTYNGKTQSIAMWCVELQLSYDVLSSRVLRGWSDEEALTTPVLTKKEQNLIPVICVETGKKYSCAKEAAKDNNISLSGIRKVLNGETKNPRCGKHFIYCREE